MYLRRVQRDVLHPYILVEETGIIVCKNPSKGLLTGFRKSAKTVLDTTVQNHVFLGNRRKSSPSKDTNFVGLRNILNNFTVFPIFSDSELVSFITVLVYPPSPGLNFQIS